MAAKTCVNCHRSLPPTAFVRDGRRGMSTRCAVCINDARRMRAPLPVIPRDPVQIRINNAANLWFGPVRREPLRNAA